MTTPATTQVTLARIMSQADTNLLGTVHGGNIMKFADDVAGAAAARFAQGPAVTAAMDEMQFHTPVRVGDILTVRARINWAGRSSMEVGVRCTVERWDAMSEPIHVASGFFTMVAVDESGRPRPVSTLEPEAPEDHRRFREAGIRRTHRLARREAIAASRVAAG